MQVVRMLILLIDQLCLEREEEHKHRNHILKKCTLCV